ncbi:nuclear transport factor 2 family protein [Streptomyces sp. NPDC051956]|uniref:nuclear transport factor 2 family protein n=1 Tax=Streptomyces sp. NPDC051956 TaxID=3365677 RepID=UPI0037CDA8F2
MIARLGRCLDQKRFEEARTIFTEDASVATAIGAVRGIDAIVNKARHVRPEGLHSELHHQPPHRGGR